MASSAVRAFSQTRLETSKQNTSKTNEPEEKPCVQHALATDRLALLGMSNSLLAKQYIGKSCRTHSTRRNGGEIKRFRLVLLNPAEPENKPEKKRLKSSQSSWNQPSNLAKKEMGHFRVIEEARTQQYVVLHSSTGTFTGCMASEGQVAQPDFQDTESCAEPAFPRLMLYMVAMVREAVGASSWTYPSHSALQFSASSALHSQPPQPSTSPV